MTNPETTGLPTGRRAAGCFVLQWGPAGQEEQAEPMGGLRSQSKGPRSLVLSESRQVGKREPISQFYVTQIPEDAK